MQTSQRLDQQEAAERRRRELLEAANRVVLRDGPEASMNAIAAEAGITKPILYRHFGDKNGLYRALAQRHTDELADLLAQLWVGRSAKNLDALALAQPSRALSFRSRLTLS